MLDTFEAVRHLRSKIWILDFDFGFSTILEFGSWVLDFASCFVS